MSKDELKKVLYKKALGYTVEEEVREYNTEDEIIKRRVTVKYIPPDINALKTYLELSTDDDKYKDMSDKELHKEAIKIYKEIKEKFKKSKEGN